MTQVRGDHPHTDPGDGRTECPTCGKFVFPAIHSCKRVPVTEAAKARAGMLPSFEDCRRAARRLLGDAADQIRAGDWKPLPTRAQRDAVRRALVLIGEAQDALDEAAHMDTIDLDEEGR